MLVQGTARRLFALRNPSVLLKLDISKAFDSLNWAFLLDVLRWLGFGRKWLGWVSGLLGIASTRVLVNGIPGALISHRRGLRQGDSLSPMLFILAMDVLNLLLRKAEEVGLFQHLASRGLTQRASFFADDAVVFLRPIKSELTACVALLDDFTEASGLRVNFSKTSAHLIRCSEEQGALVHRILGCAIGPFPCTYLGLPLTLCKPSAGQLACLVEKVEKRLQMWSAHLFSTGGRLTLVRFTLSAMPIYAMMLLDLPVKTIEAIEKLCRGFLWKGRKEVRGGHCLVA